MIQTIIRESFLGGKPDRVDREKGIIYGVKVLGRSSPNTHGVDGVTGTEYTEAALKNAAKLYEGLKVNINHPDRTKPGKDRSTYDRFGKLFNIRFENGDLYGNLAYLTSHKMAGPIAEAAERADMSDCFGLSHNAMGQGEVRNGKYVILEIPEVRSVDVVADGGTVRGLFESKEGQMKTFRAIIESIPGLNPGKALKRLLEDIGDLQLGKDDQSQPVDLGQALADAINAIMTDTSLSCDQKKKKIMKIVEVSDTQVQAPADSDAPPDSSSDTTGDNAGGDASASDPTKKKKKDTTESREEALRAKLTALQESIDGGEKREKKIRKVERKLAKPEQEKAQKMKKKLKKLEESRQESKAETRALREQLDAMTLENWIRDEAGKRQLGTTSDLLESLAAIKDRDKIGKHLDYLKSQAVPRRFPQSRGPGGKAPDAVDTPEGFQAALRN